MDPPPPSEQPGLPTPTSPAEQQPAAAAVTLPPPPEPAASVPTPSPPSEQAPAAAAPTEATTVPTPSSSSAEEATKSAAVPPSSDPPPSGQTAEAPGPSEGEPEKKKMKAEPLVIPKAAVKRIMKLDGDVNQVANDAVILVAKATELFMDKFTREAYAQSVRKNRRTLKYEDVADARVNDPSLEFMKGVIPPASEPEEP